jgi:uncharacterized protein YlxP (DUF503 family)
MFVAALTLELRIPGCHSLKQKRSRIKSLIARLHREFNISVAEIDHNNNHQRAMIACAAVSNDAQHARNMLARIPAWIEKNRPDLQLIDEHYAIL